MKLKTSKFLPSVSWPRVKEEGEYNRRMMKESKKKQSQYPSHEPLLLESTPARVSMETVLLAAARAAAEQSKQEKQKRLEESGK